MRQKRAKSYRKQMLVYQHTFKFREPYQTIVHSDIVTLCQSASFDVAKGINRTIQAEIKPMITQCCMQALYSTKNQDAIDIAKKFERRRCNHPPKAPLDPSECVESIVNVDGKNKHRYIVATQDHELRKKLRQVPGTPLVYMNRSVMVMEPLSKKSAQISESLETSKLTGGLNDAKNAGIVPKDVPEGKKRKGPKAPNPLSVKKKKVEAPEADAPKKRKRRHKSKSENHNEDGNGEHEKAEPTGEANDE
ncbi:rRNA-processing protein UTP23 [Meyerozyma sp. JA9]|nr:rRNA-processing protein UTP23 [Meyerozyma sp. JA9]